LLTLVLRSISSRLQCSKYLEFALRASSRDLVPELASECVSRWSRDHPLFAKYPVLLVRRLFNEVALSPYSPFIEHLTDFLLALSVPSMLGAQPVADLYSYMLRHLVRHLTSYDLRTFHNRGANYPDALALDTFLRAFISIVDRAPDAFDGTDLP